jgi:hypothetical protein
LVTERDNLSPTPEAANDVPAVKNKVTATVKNVKTRLTTGYYSRFHAGNEPAQAPARHICRTTNQICKSSVQEQHHGEYTAPPGLRILMESSGYKDSSLDGTKNAPQPAIC